MGASTKKIETTPAQTDKFRTGVIDYLNDPRMGGLGRISSGPVASLPGMGGVVDRGQMRDVFAPGRGTIRDIMAPNRGQIRDVNAQGTQSVDQLGGANSPFFQNMMAQLSPAFDMQRKLAAAQGSESAGNLTGSGFANRLGGQLNRTMGDQQAMLANYALQGLQTEVGRQQGDAGRNLQGQMANQGADQFSSGQGMQAQMANQGADQFSAGQDLQAMLANQGMDANFINQLLNQRGQDMNYALTGRGQDLNAANQNADRFAGLVGQQGTAGVAPSDVIQSGGAGALLGPLAQGLGGYLGGGGSMGKIGGGILDMLGLGGGGGGNISLPPAGTGGTWGSAFPGGIPGMSVSLPSEMGAGGYQTGGFNPGASTRGGGNSFTDGPGGWGGMQGGNILEQILRGTGSMGSTGGGMAGILQQLLGGRGGQAQGGGMMGNLGGMLGGVAGKAIPIPILGPMIGSMFGRGAGNALGKVGGAVKGLFGRLF